MSAIQNPPAAKSTDPIVINLTSEEPASPQHVQQKDPRKKESLDLPLPEFALKTSKSFLSGNVKSTTHQSLEETPLSPTGHQPVIQNKPKKSTKASAALSKTLKAKKKPRKKPSVRSRVSNPVKNHPGLTSILGAETVKMLTNSSNKTAFKKHYQMIKSAEVLIGGQNLTYQQAYCCI